VLSEGRRADPNIDANIEDRCARASHKRRLEAQAAQHPFLRGANVVVLDEARLDAVSSEDIRAIGLREKNPDG
jgi:hypothetical protein